MSASEPEAISDPQVILDTLTIGESPRWHDDRLWVCNWGAAEVVALTADGSSERVLDAPAAIPFCIDWLPDGSLLLVSGQEGKLLRYDRDGSGAVHADLSGISRGGWNEIVVDGRGNAYVNGGGFDLMAGEPFAPGVIALVSPDGTTREVADDIHFPNGMAMTPDERTLIVAESYGRRLTAFDVLADGGLANRRVWAELGDGVPDGICLDAEGAVWYADVPNRQCVRVAEGGEILGLVEADRGCFACMLGGVDGRTLFIVAAEWRGPDAMFTGEPSGQVLAARAPAPAAGRPQPPGGGEILAAVLARLLFAFAAAALLFSMFLNWFPGGIEGAYLNRSIGAPAFSGVFSVSGATDAWRAFSVLDVMLASLAAATAVAALTWRPSAVAAVAAVAAVLGGVVLYRAFEPPTLLALLGPGIVVAFGSLVLIAVVGATVALQRNASQR